MFAKRLAGLAFFMVASQAHAVTTAFDFTTLGGNNQALAQNVTVNGVNAAAYTYTFAPSTWSTTNTTLWLREQTNDNGLGICSETNCGTGGGDVNEISSLTHLEVLRLTRSDNTKWVSLFVSSLDGNGGTSVEDGTLYYSNTALPDLSTASFVQFKSGDFGSSVEGDLFTLAAFNVAALKEAKYLFFKPGAPSVNNDNNDFLVWKGAVESTNPPNEVPEPSTYLMLLAGLGMLGFMVKRRTNG